MQEPEFCKKNIWVLSNIWVLGEPEFCPKRLKKACFMSGFFFSPFGPKLSSIKTQFLAKTQIKNFLKLSFSENYSKKISSALLMKIVTD